MLTANPRARQKSETKQNKATKQNQSQMVFPMFVLNALKYFALECSRLRPQKHLRIVFMSPALHISSSREVFG
jgi:hypothetical protein